jgi:hypothetical protein
LGWNGIGDVGCIHLATMLESNTLLLRIGLGENDVFQYWFMGTMEVVGIEIVRCVKFTGLYHKSNGSKVLLSHPLSVCSILTHVEKITSEYEAQLKVQQMMEASLSAMDTWAEPLDATLPTPDEGSESSLDWADKNSLLPERPPGHRFQKSTHLMFPWGIWTKIWNTMDIVPVANVSTKRNKTAAAAPPVSDETGWDVSVTSKPKKSRYAEMPLPKTEMDRSTVFQSAPLAYFNEETTLHHAFPLHDFDHEKAATHIALAEGALAVRSNNQVGS